jgi:hypothetical protein
MFIDNFLSDAGSEDDHSHDLENAQQAEDTTSHTMEDNVIDDHDEDAEFKDEEAMIQKAYEISQSTAAQQQDEGAVATASDVGVQDEHGNTYFMPASMFEDLNNDEDNVTRLNSIIHDHKDPQDTSSNATTTARYDTAGYNYMGMYKVARFGSNCLVRAKHQYLLDKESLE